MQAASLAPATATVPLVFQRGSPTMNFTGPVGRKLHRPSESSCRVIHRELETGGT
ncbi:hypothetical protein QTP88_013324 [Uroleucon formosanum]